MKLSEVSIRLFRAQKVVSRERLFKVPDPRKHRVGRQVIKRAVCKLVNQPEIFEVRDESLLPLLSEVASLKVFLWFHPHLKCRSLVFELFLKILSLSHTLECEGPTFP